MEFTVNNFDSFYIFAKYINDLTAIKASGGKVMPSKYILVENNQYTSTNIIEKLNIINNKYINDNNIDFKKNFWNDFKEIITIDTIHYIDEINIQSYNSLGEVCWDEIFCHVPCEAKSNKYDNVGVDEIPTGNTGVIREEYKNYFTINNIILFYNIYDIYDNILIEDIPLGWFIPVQPIIKTVYSDDIYGSGTSLGIRICTAYSSNSQLANIEITSDVNNDIIDVLCSLGDSAKKMVEISEEIANKIQINKELYSIFKNSSTNVPYVKKSGDDYFWFINGKRIENIPIIEI